MAAAEDIKKEIKNEKNTEDTVGRFLNFSAFCDKETEQILAQDPCDEDEFIEPVFANDGSAAQE